MYVCVCKAVTDSQLETAINGGLNTRRQLFDCLGVGSDCGKCNSEIRELINHQLANELTTIAKNKLIA